MISGHPGCDQREQGEGDEGGRSGQLWRANRLRMEEVATPALAADQVLVRVHASSVNMGDRLVMRGVPYIMRVAGGSLGFGFRGPSPRSGGSTWRGQSRRWASG